MAEEHAFSLLLGLLTFLRSCALFLSTRSPAGFCLLFQFAFLSLSLPLCLSEWARLPWILRKCSPVTVLWDQLNQQRCHSLRWHSWEAAILTNWKMQCFVCLKIVLVAAGWKICLVMCVRGYVSTEKWFGRGLWWFEPVLRWPATKKKMLLSHLTAWFATWNAKWRKPFCLNKTSQVSI